MRRDQFELTVEGVTWVEETDADPRRPVVHIETTDAGAADLLRSRLTDPEEELLAAEATDVTFRLLDDADDTAEGVVSVTNRETGAFILEMNADAEDVLQFIRAARRYGEHAETDGQYGVTITVDGESLVEYDKTTFLVYDSGGELLRNHSLIPSGVEL